jgi:hypothetical protein
VYWPESGGEGTSEPATAHFYSAVAATRVPKAGGGSTVHHFDGGGAGLPLVLWDTGAQGASSVPQDVLALYLDFYAAARPAVEAAIAARFNTSIVNGTDANVVSSTCGGNTAEDPSGGSGPAPWVMNTVQLPENATAADVEFARTQLAAMFPATIDVELSNGAVAPIPGSFLVNGCGRDGATTNVTVCSFMRASSSGGTHEFWFAVPWFESRFVQFDVSAAVQNTTQYGVMRFTTSAVNCTFDTS